MANATPKATRKKSIVPVTLTLTVTATKVNENGTFSSFSIDSVKGPNKTATAVAPPQGGGSIYLKVSSMEGLDILAEDEKGNAPKPKLF